MDPRKRILIVDDDPCVASAVRRILAREYNVTCLTSSCEAFARIAYGERYDVILSDLCMGGLAGNQLFDDLSRLVPEQAEIMLFMTGGPNRPQLAAFADSLPAHRLLKKPFPGAHLLAIVARIIKGTDGGALLESSVTPGSGQLTK